MRQQFYTFFFVMQLVLQRMFVINFKLRVAEIAIYLFNFFSIRRNQLFFVAVDNTEKRTAVFTDFQNIAEVKAKALLPRYFFDVIFRNRNNAVGKVHIAGSLIICIADQKGVGGARIAVFYGFGVFQNQGG